MRFVSGFERRHDAGARRHDQRAARHRPRRHRRDDEVIALLRQHRVEKLPLIDDDGKLAGLITVKDFDKSEKFPARHEGRPGPPARRRGDRLLRRRLGARRGAARRRASTCSSSTPPTASPPGVIDMVARLKADPSFEHIARHRRQRRDPRGRAGAHRRGRGCRQGRRRPGLDLHDPRRRRRRRAAGHRRLRGVARRARGRHPGHRRRRPAVLRRHRQGARRRRRHRHARLAARRHRRVAGRDRLPGRQAVQAVPRHGLARRDADARQEDLVLEGPLLPGRRPDRRQAHPRGHRGPGRLPRPGRRRRVPARRRPAPVDVLRRRAHDRRAARRAGKFVRITAAGLQGVAPARRAVVVEAPNYSG